MALVVFGVPIKGSFLMLTLCTLLYVTATTGIGMVTSTFTSSQVAAVFVTAILTIMPTIQFSGLAAAGLDAGGQRPAHRLDLADDLLHALQPGRLHQGARARPHDAGHRLSGLLHPDPLGSQHDRPEEAGEIAMKSLLNILWLGLKELRSLMSDLVMVVFVIYAFTLAIYVQATGTSSEVNNASIAFVDEDGSALSKELFNAFYPPRFQLPEMIAASEVEDAMDKGRFMFVVVIPPRFEHDLRAGRNPDIQVNIDATAMQQAGIGAGYIKNIINDRIAIVPAAHGRDGRRAHQPGRSQAVQPERRLLLVQERGGHHQSDHAADGRADGRRGDPRARARDARAPAGDAADRVRDRDGEGVGQRPGDPRRDGGVALPGRADGAEGAVRRLGRCCGSSASCSICSSRRRSGSSWGRFRDRWRSSRCLIILVVVVLQLLSGGIDAGREPAEMAAVPHVSSCRRGTSSASRR